MNFREIFNMNYSYIGLVFIGLLIGLLFLLDKNIGIKVIGYSFLIAGICLGIMYFLGNMIVSSFSYSFFIEIISDNFFDSIMIILMQYMRRRKIIIESFIMCLRN